MELYYSESLKAGGVIGLLRRFHEKHGKAMAILDNAGAHKG